MIKFRLYYDKDAETDWLQKVVKQGWRLKKFFLGFYTFEPCNPGEYNYQIDLLTNWSGKRSDYTEFMEGINVHVVAQWWRWVYLEKRAEDGPFELYTDTESLIEQYSRIKNFFTVALVIELFCLFIELSDFFVTGGMPVVSLFVIILFGIVLVFLRIVWKCKWKIDEMKRMGR